MPLNPNEARRKTMELNTLTGGQLKGSIAALEDAKARRQGGLLVTEQTALDNLKAEQAFREKLEGYVAEVKRLVLKDIADGTMPADVKTFSEMHDHVDANEYLIDAMPGYDWGLENGSIDYANRVADTVDEWLRNGRK
jgi:hypothetical protein